jgi:hypothetical protein
VRARALILLALGGLVPLAGCGEDADAPHPAQAAAAAFELPGPEEVREWSADATPLAPVEGRLTLDGSPVAGARISVGGYRLWALTDDDGRFQYPLDATLARRHPVTVADAADATVDGEALSSDQLAAVEQATGAITAGHRLDEIEAERDGEGVTITGRVTVAGAPAETVALVAYELTGRVVDASGRPVEDAIVSTRTTDRDFWTFSEPSDSRGRYRSNFGASDRIGSNPVPITVHVAVGNEAYAFLSDETVLFERLKSAEMDIRLPPEGYPLALPEPRSYAGASYTGVVVGATVDGRPVRPTRATWPDSEGRFELTLPGDLAGATVSLWAGELELFSRRPAEPGGPIDLARWPGRLPEWVPRDLAEVGLPD